MSKTWTEEELFMLSEWWGTKSIPTIAKNLGRSETAIMIRANRLSLSSFLTSGDYVSFNALMVALTRCNSHSYQNLSWISNRKFPVRKKRVHKNTFRVVYIAEFWKWAEKNKHFLDFSNFEEGLLGEEPGWVKIKRKLDIEENFLVTNRPWTDVDDGRLLTMLRSGNYTVFEMGRILLRSAGAIQRRIIDLKTPLRPVKSPAKRYDSEEIEFITQGIKDGMGYAVMAHRLERSDKALRGFIFNRYLTEDLDKVSALIGNGKFGDGIPTPTVKQGLVLSKHRAAVRKDLSILAGLLKNGQMIWGMTRSFRDLCAKSGIILTVVLQT